MRIEPDSFGDVLIVDVQTRRYGNSAMKIASDRYTEVVFGGLHVSVRLRDLHVEVIMDPEGSEEQWKDLAWAREQAMSVLCRPDVAPRFIVALADFRFKVGEHAGRKALRDEFRRLIGVSADNEDYDSKSVRSTPMGQIRHPNATTRSRKERREAAQQIDAASDAAKLKEYRRLKRVVEKKAKAGDFAEGSSIWNEQMAAANDYRLHYKSAIGRAIAREIEAKEAARKNLEEVQSDEG